MSYHIENWSRYDQQQVLKAFNWNFERMRGLYQPIWDGLYSQSGNYSEADRQLAIGYHLTAEGVKSATGRVLEPYETPLLLNQPRYDWDDVYKTDRFPDRVFKEVRRIPMEFMLAHQLRVVQDLSLNVKNARDFEQLNHERHMLDVLVASSRPERVVQMSNPDGMVGRYEEAAFEQEARNIAGNHVRRSRFDVQDPRANEDNWYTAVNVVRSRLGLFVPKSPLESSFGLELSL